MEHVNGLFCGTDRALTPLADGILKVLNRLVIGAENLKRAGEQQGVAKIVWHGMPPEWMSRPYIGTRGIVTRDRFSSDV